MFVKLLKEKHHQQNVLHDKGEVAIGLFVLFLLSALFALGIIVLVMIKKGYFKVDEENIYLRVLKCATLAAGLTLALLLSSCAGMWLSDLLFSSRNQFNHSLVQHIALLAPQTLKFFLELTSGLFIADFISRKMNKDFLRKNSMRIGLFISFTSIAAALTYLFNEQFFVIQIVKILLDMIMSPITTAIGMISAMQFFLFNPVVFFQYALNISVFNMSNIFNYEPFMGGILLFITAISFASTLMRRKAI